MKDFLLELNNFLKISLNESDLLEFSKKFCSKNFKISDISNEKIVNLLLEGIDLNSFKGVMKKISEQISPKENFENYWEDFIQELSSFSKRNSIKSIIIINKIKKIFKMSKIIKKVHQETNVFISKSV